MTRSKSHPLDQFFTLVHSSKGALCIGNDIIIFSSLIRLEKYKKANDKQWDFNGFSNKVIYRKYVPSEADKARKHIKLTSVLVDPLRPGAFQEGGGKYPIEQFALADDRTESEKAQEKREAEELSRFKKKK